ncbi:MAG: three-Cys-motif partner protein TcmP [Bacteroidota bacterium]|nr:three-Cys-motif partner protein TcmP [Bacteroidota bacterium]
MIKDIHKKVFDDSTKAKLELFRLYLREWLPVFIMQEFSKIEIHDYFAGEGTDVEGNSGSPLIILDEIKDYCFRLNNKNIKMILHLNDFDKKKIEKLKRNTYYKLQDCAKEKIYDFCNVTVKNNNCPFEIKFYNKEFSELFNKDYRNFIINENVPRLIFIDQYGIKQVNDDVFKKLTTINFTDFMFFISSSHIIRFKEQEAFKKYLDTKKIDFTDKRPAECHRVVFEYFKGLIPSGYFLGQFSIKKNANYYGLIFGSKNHLGMKKFLDVAWKIDNETGEANHNIDNDPIREGQMTLDFNNNGKANKVKKLSKFTDELLNFLKKWKTNKDLYIYALEKGIKVKIVNDILNDLENKNKLIVQSSDNRRKGYFYLELTPTKRIRIKTL